MGINTLLLSVSSVPLPDLIAVSATAPPNDGVVRIAKGSVGAFAIATKNIGATSSLVAEVSDTSGKLPRGTLAICQTDSEAQCLAPPTFDGVQFTLAKDGSTTFSVFVAPRSEIPFDPEHNRLFVNFRDILGISRGRTSVAVMTTR